MSTNRSSKYRSRGSSPRLIGLSISYQRENLLSRGLGLEHLRELLLRLARPLLRQGASLAYGGHWHETEDNFTFDLLRLISAEQEDNSLGGPDTNLVIGRLYNHSPWPGYLDVTPRVEAQWINCCRIVRITQQLAGISDADLVPDSEARSGSDRAILNTAISLSAMRRLAVQGVMIAIPGLASPEAVPPVCAGVILGGKVHGFSGFMPGIFEEALVALEKRMPLYILGGFGGAAEILAKALLEPVGHRRDELTIDWQNAHTPTLVKLAHLSQTLSCAPGLRGSSASLDLLATQIDSAKSSLADALNTGLAEAATRELLVTQDMRRAVQLVRDGLANKIGLQTLPA